jgi:PrtD family type I secretion system ABC transporter
MKSKTENLLMSTLRMAKPAFVYTGLFSFFINLLMLMVPLYSLQVLDRVMSTGSLETLFWLSAIMVIGFLAASALQSLRAYMLIRVGEWVDEHMCTTLLSRSLAHAAKTGARGTQNLRDLSIVKSFMTGTGLMTLFDIPWSVISLIVIFCMHVQLGLITLAGCVLLLGLAWLNEIAMQKPLDEANAINIKNYQQVDIAMRNAEVIEAMGMTDTVASYWQKANRKMIALQSLASNRSAIIQALTKFLRLDLQIAIYGWGAYLALNHEITSGAIIAASILAARALQPFDAAISIWKSAIEARESYHRLNNELDKMATDLPGISLPAPEGRLLIDRVVYAAPGRGKAIIKNLSFSLDAGDALGLIGPSAAGKSTLAKLIVGTWKPYSGVVRLDGGDVCQWKREEFGKYVGYLPQDIELFSGTVKDNIARLIVNAPDEAIIAAAKMAGAHELVMALPEGYNTDIGPGGAALSAGQRQRIGLARACFGEPKLLVLDEPDASLDTEGEVALMQTLARAKAQHITTIVISHRPGLLGFANKLLVLNEGELKIFGPTAEVLASLRAQQGQPAITEQTHVASVAKPNVENPFHKLHRRTENVSYPQRA